MNTITRRGFTFHEHLDSTELIHMNGRVYDPVIGRFVSADPFVANPFATQSFNRYSYVENNPLSLRDPSGFTPECPMCETPSNRPVIGPWTPPDWFRHLTDLRGNRRPPASFIRYHNGALPAHEWDIPEGTRRSDDVFSPQAGRLDALKKIWEGLKWLKDRFLPRNRQNPPETPKAARVGETLRTVDDVMANPALLKGKSRAEVEALLRNTPGWRQEALGRGTHRGQGWVLREYLPNGQATGRMVRWHPGGGRHGPNPYWVVTQANRATIRVPAGGS